MDEFIERTKLQEMKNVLIIPPYNPYPLVSGGHQAIFNGIAILKDVANVYIYVETTESQHKRGDDRKIEQVLPFVHVLANIDPASKHTIKWYWKVLMNKMRSVLRIKGTQKQVEIPRLGLEPICELSERKIEFVLDAIKKYHIGIVQVEMMPDIKLINYLPKTIKTIFVQHEIKFVRDELLLQTMGNVTDEMKAQYIQNKKEEIELHNQYDYVITLSPIDTRKLIDAGVTSPITTSLAIVNPAGHQSSSETSVRKVLSYVGPEMHYPNYDGIMWFLENCWSRLLAKDSEYVFQIIGMWSEQTAVELAEKYNNKVKCIGFVDDLGEALAGTTMIVPLNIGSGIRMKILEAAQFNVPVVTTRVGGEGLPLVNGENSFIADEADEFVEDIIKLQDKRLRDKFVMNIRKTITDKYSLQALKESRMNIYK